MDFGGCYRSAQAKSWRIVTASGSFAVSIAILERLIASRIQAYSYWIMAIYMTNDPLVACQG